MKANPGGQIDIANVIGRDEFIKTLWDRLENQSLLLTAERRIGKTTILKKMLSETPAGFVAIYQDLEGLSTPDQFVEAVGLKIRTHFNLINRTLFEGDRLINRLGGGEAQGVRLPTERQKNWKSHLPGLIDKVSLGKDRQLLLLWDELPQMIYNIKEKSGAGVAMDVLDAIRNLRQDQNTKMILTGSIGLHHVIDDLRTSGYSNEPVNDLYQADVMPLSQAHATELACKLLEGEGIPTEDTDAVADEIAETADHWPFYIHRLVVSLKEKRKSVNPQLVRDVAQESISIAADPWDLRHYRVRIHTYYKKDEAPIALAILDTLSNASEPMKFDDLFNHVQSVSKNQDREAIKNTLRLLELDHYVSQHSPLLYQFQCKLVKRWWKQSK